MKTLNEEYQDQLKWFIRRIGKRIYRVDNGCICKSCVDVAKFGLVIKDKAHAEYLNDCSAEAGYKYFDQK